MVHLGANNQTEECLATREKWVEGLIKRASLL